jgi:hypothetical protein
VITNEEVVSAVISQIGLNADPSYVAYEVQRWLDEIRRAGFDLVRRSE